MPVQDWAGIDSGIFHDLHTVWLGQLRTALNNGVLPEGYYALTEQHAGRSIADVLTLHASPVKQSSPPPSGGGTAVADAPPRTRHQQTIESSVLSRRRTLAIRHVSGHRIVALLEILSPGNKDRAVHVAQFEDKVTSALDLGVHVLFVDLFRPGTHDPQGMHGIVSQRLDPSIDPYDLPAEEPFTLAAYAAGPQVEIHVEHLGPKADLPDMPLFVRPDYYVNVPLQDTYDEAYRGIPAFWREILETNPQ